MKKKLFALLLATALIFSLLPAATAASSTSGQCGPEAFWSYNSDNHFLTISGTGPMDDFQFTTPWDAFKNEIRLVSVEEGITTIGNSAFMEFPSLTFARFPASLERIGHQAFFGCTNLTDASLPPFVAEIGSSAFSNTGLTSVSIPGATTHIGNGAFADCVDLKRATLGSGLIRAEGSVFRGCTSLSEVTMSEMPNLESFGAMFFMDCDSLTDLSFYTAPFIDGNMFSKCDGLTEITIPDSVTHLGEEGYSFAFSDCANLTTVTLHAGVEVVGNCAFDSCNALTEVCFEGSAPVFGDAAFQGTNLTCYYPASDPTWNDVTGNSYGGNVTWVPAGNQEDPEPVATSGELGTNARWSYDVDTATLTITGTNALPKSEECPWEAWRQVVEAAIISEGITDLGSNLFRGHSALKDVQLPASLDFLGICTFEDCLSLTEITLPDGLYQISGGAFRNSALNRIVMPDSVKELGNSAFENCACLESVRFSSGLWSVGSEVFAGCTRLTEIIMPDMPELTSVGKSVFRDCDSLTDLSFLNIPEIGSFMFSNCDGLVDITIPDCVTRIAGNPPANIGEAFAECYNLRSVTIPGSVEYIGKLTFSMCDALEAVYFLGDAPELASNSLPGYPAKVYYPQDNATWTEELRAQHNVQWVPFDGQVNPFTDVKQTDYFYSPVLWAVENNITAGTGNGNFSPSASCTRAQVVTFLHRAAGTPEPQTATNPFTDVKETDYFYKAVLWAVENGITAGMSADTFAPNATCTRAQVVTFLHRAAGTPAPENTDNPFTDVAESDYFYNAVLWARSTNVTQGTSATAFSPNNDCTRGQVVTFLYRTRN